MIDVLYFSDRDVKRKLFTRVAEAKKPVLVSATRHGPFMRPVEEREPFASIERAVGDAVDQIIVADEGTVEGMWRDPVGDLADAFEAAPNGYLLFRGGQLAAELKKRGDARDVHAVHAAVSRIDDSVPPPSGRAPTAEEIGSMPTPPRPDARSRKNARPSAKDPFALLGIARDATLDDARKAFRALVSQYHPDKVAHLAQEFRDLAELRTRQILEAWEKVEAALKNRAAPGRQNK